MEHLYKRDGSVHWQARFRDPVLGKTVRESTYLSKKADAQKWLQARMAERQEAAKHVGAGKRPITFGDAFGAYVGALRDRGGSRAHATKAASLMRKTLGLDREIADTKLGGSAHRADRWVVSPHRLLHTLDPADVALIVRSRLREGNGVVTVGHEIQNLRAATRYAMSLGMRGPDAMFNGSVQSPWRIPRQPRKTRYLSWGEWQRLYDHLSPDRTTQVSHAVREQRQDAQDLAVALVFTGARWSEIARLTWGQVDIASRLITLWGNKVSKERVVSIPEPLVAVLVRRMADSKWPGETSTSPIWRGLEGGWRQDTSCKPILRAMEAIGLNDPESVRKHGRAVVHSLRHTYASWLAQNGASIGEVQQALGHTTPTMTTRYAHLMQSQTADKLGRIMNNMERTANV